MKVKVFSASLISSVVVGLLVFVYARSQEVSVDSAPHIAVTIVRFKDGFSPTQVTIKKGETVAFKNFSDVDMWPASDSHPLHDEYALFDPHMPIKPGDQWIFTFNEVGEWGFHDHLRSNRTGKVIVR